MTAMAAASIAVSLALTAAGRRAAGAVDEDGAKPDGCQAPHRPVQVSRRSAPGSGSA